MSNKYHEAYDKMINCMLLEIRGITSGDSKKEEHIAKANMYANAAQALIPMLSGTIVEMPTEEIKEPVTKEALKPQPRVVGSEDSPEISTVEPPKEETPKPVEDQTEIAEQVGELARIMSTMIDTSQHPEGYSIPMNMVMHWASQAVEAEIKDQNDLNDHLDKLPNLLDYFRKLDYIFNQLNATIDDAQQALTVGTQEHWTKIEEMTPDNIDIVVGVFKDYIEKSQQEA